MVSSDVIEVDVVVEESLPAPAAPRITLGCDCEAPLPRGPESALCDACGLVYLTSEEYSEHLARGRTVLAQSADADQPGSDEGRSRRWWRIRSRA
jgi:hypothetical protein